MYAVKAGYELINIKDPVEKIERVARVCYKSEDKIKAGSAERMVRALIKRKHEAMIEHTSLAVQVGTYFYRYFKAVIGEFENSTGVKSYLRFSFINKPIISGNMRAWRDAIVAFNSYGCAIPSELASILLSNYAVFFEDIARGWRVDAQEWFTKEIDPSTLPVAERKIHEDLTVLFTVDRGVSHEIVRHRPCSFAQESTRYCNYGNSGGVAYVIPCYYEPYSAEMLDWEMFCCENEREYLARIEAGDSPQEARGRLSHHVKTEVVVTANLNEWIHFFKLRALGVTGAPHPQIVEVALPLYKEMQSAIPAVFGDLEERSHG